MTANNDDRRRGPRRRVHLPDQPIVRAEEADPFTKEDWVLLHAQMTALREFWRRRLDARKQSPTPTPGGAAR